jgi:hypothetical protein
MLASEMQEGPEEETTEPTKRTLKKK